MKKVLIIGAGGSLATYVTEALLNRDDVLLTLFLRNKKKISPSVAASCTIMEGDAMNTEQLKSAINGQDIVYVNLAGNLEAMTENIVHIMQECGVRRIIAISSIGIYDLPLKPVLKPYRKLADVIENSGLDYTILRPDWFTYGNEIDYAITRKGSPETGQAVSRKSIAAFIAAIIADPAQYVQENLGISRPD